MQTVSERLDVSGVFHLFEQAISHKLKYPKIRLQTESGQIVILKRAGDKSKYTGQIQITDEKPFGSNLYFGRISLDGELFPTSSATPEVISLLQSLSVDPVFVASNYGRLTGRCCFCDLPLTDKRSTAEGYGPVCADHFGLPWGNFSKAKR